MLNVYTESRQIQRKLYGDQALEFPVSVYESKPLTRKWMIVSQNPSKSDNDREREEKNEPLENLSDDKKGFLNWIIIEKKEFFRDFFSTIDGVFSGTTNSIQLKDVNYETWAEKRFFDVFYITDAVKIRGSTGKFGESLKKRNGFSSKEIQEEWRKLLLKEIETVKPRFLITFGAYPFNELRRLFSKYYEIKKEPITKAHAKCVCIRELEFSHIPLAFPPTGMTHYLRDSYIDYLKEGLTKLRARISE